MCRLAFGLFGGGFGGQQLLFKLLQSLIEMRNLGIRLLFPCLIVFRYPRLLFDARPQPLRLQRYLGKLVPALLQRSPALLFLSAERSQLGLALLKPAEVILADGFRRSHLLLGRLEALVHVAVTARH